MKTTTILAAALLLASPATGMAATLGLDTENVFTTATGILTISEGLPGQIVLNGFSAAIQSTTNLDINPVDMFDFSSTISAATANTWLFAYESSNYTDYALGQSTAQAFGFTDTTLEFVVELDIYNLTTPPEDWLITVTLPGTNMGDEVFAAPAFGDYNAEYKVSKIAQIAPVPLPAAGLMLLGGLGGLAALRRKASQKG